MSYGDKSLLDMQGNQTPVDVTMTGAEANAMQTVVFAAMEAAIVKSMAVAVAMAGGDPMRFVVDLYSGWRKLTLAASKACGDGGDADREFARANGLLAAQLDQVEADLGREEAA